MKSLKIKISDIKIVLLLLIPCITFILEEMITNYSLCTAIMIVFLIIPVLLTGNLSKKRLSYSYIWFFYAAAVCLSVLQRNIIQSLMMDVIIILLIVLNIIISQNKVIDYAIGCKMLCIFGIANSAGVLLQFIFRERYNNIYLKLFANGWEQYALKYFNRGYHTGLQAVPGDAAGLIVFSIGIIISYYFLCRYHKNRTNLILPAAMIILLFTLFLTGKKGVLVSGVLSIVIVYLLLMAQRKQWIKIIVAVIVFCVAYIIFRNFVIEHSDNPMFYRLAQFFEQLSQGDSQGATTGRTILYEHAISLWKNHKWFGIGWRKFREYTVGIYGYEIMHDVNLDYLQFLCECGIVGFVLILIPIVITFRRAVIVVQSVLKRNLEFREQWVILAGGFLQFFTIIYAFLEIPFFDRVFFVAYAFSCIIINNAYSELKLDTVNRSVYEN